VSSDTPPDPANDLPGKPISGKPDHFLASAARYVGVATALPGAIVAGYLIGVGLDAWLHTTYLKIVFLVLGIVSGFLELVRQLLRDMKIK
jgi:F0F1-type ATP synthase assembly protein I